jgi:hypothetical protein
MTHRAPGKIAVSLNILNNDACEENFTRSMIQIQLCALLREIEAGLEDMTLKEDQRREYKALLASWDNHYKAIHDQEDDLSSRVGSRTDFCCSRRTKTSGGNTL